MVRAAGPIIAIATVAVLALSVAATAQPRLATNQAEIEALSETASFALDDPLAVFGFVFEQLPERVKVYPTENHYYFSFVAGGTRYLGNIKIDARLRDQGKVSFAYFEELQPWREEGRSFETILDGTKSVTVEKVAPLAYRLSYRDKSVLFELNDLAEAKPSLKMLGADESLIGPIFDESGVRFFLVFNAKLKIFHYLLDETITPADEFLPLPRFDRILIGRRTGFALYRDLMRRRKILIGAFEGNVLANNMLDGPFDQLPDNFIEGDSLRRAILAVEPSLAGEIDRFGGFADGERYAIVPYMHYRQPRDLQIFHRCATDRRVPASDYYRCFVLDGPSRGPGARPLVLQRRSR